MNVAAIEEYKTVRERYDFLRAQIADAEHARDELHSLIGRLTEEMKKRFLAQFRTINEAFDETFRDLFGGDGEAYEEAIATLNAFDDFDECMIHIAENYAWNPNSDGAKFMMELLERKFA